MKRLVFWGFLPVCLGVLFSIYLFVPSKLVEIPLFFSSSLYPLVKAEIGEKTYFLNLDLSSKCLVYVEKEYLDGMQKILKKTVDQTEYDGDVHSAPLYQLPKISVGGLSLKKVEAKSEENRFGGVGTFTWPFSKLNLVLDYPHHKVWGVNKEKNLRDLGLKLEKMAQLKIEYGPENHIVLPIMTDLGEFRFGLTTMCNGNVISLNHWKKEEGEYLTTSVQIEGRDMGLQDFHPFDIPAELGVDGFLGYGFLSTHIVYIDASNQVLYIGGDKGNTLSNGSMVKLPIAFTPSNLPVTECKIEGKFCHALIDLGSSRDLTCHASQIQTDTLRHIYTVQGVNLWDEKQEQKVYAFPSYRLGKAEIKNLTLTAGDTLRTDTGISMKNIGDFVGSYFTLGRPLLYRSNIYFDFPNAAMYLVDSKDRMKQLKVDLIQFEKVPYELTPSGICLNVNVGSKELRLCLDTGASACLFRSDVELDIDLTEDSLGNSCYRVDSFQIGDSIYGPQVLYPLEIASRWEFDGLLGMDFLRKHPFFIDDKFIYFKKLVDAT